MYWLPLVTGPVIHSVSPLFIVYLLWSGIDRYSSVLARAVDSLKSTTTVVLAFEIIPLFSAMAEAQALDAALVSDEIPDDIPPLLWYAIKTIMKNTSDSEARLDDIELSVLEFWRKATPTKSRNYQTPSMHCGLNLLGT